MEYQECPYFDTDGRLIDGVCGLNECKTSCEGNMWYCDFVDDLMEKRRLENDYAND